MASSTIPAAKAALLAQLAARVALTGVQVAYGWPGAPQRELIVLADAKGTQDPAALGRLKRDEFYELDVYARVQRPGTDQQSATERAFVIAAEVENQLRADPQINSTVLIAQIGGEFSLQEFADDQSRSALVTVHIHVHGRI